MKAACPPIVTEVPSSEVGAFTPLKSEAAQDRALFQRPQQVARAAGDADRHLVEDRRGDTRGEALDRGDRVAQDAHVGRAGVSQ